MDEKALERPYRALQIALGGTAVAAGADKFLHLLTDWEQYLNEDFADMLGLSSQQFMSLVGLVEIAAGVTVLSGKTRFGGILVSAWLLGISANLFSKGKFFDIAVRDINMAVAAYTLAELAHRRVKAKREGRFELDRAA